MLALLKFSHPFDTGFICLELSVVLPHLIILHYIEFKVLRARNAAIQYSLKCY